MWVGAARLVRRANKRIDCPALVRSLPKSLFEHHVELLLARVKVLLVLRQLDDLCLRFDGL